MRVIDALDRLDPLLRAGLALLATVTFVARIPAVDAWSGRRYLGQLDLWTEGSIAALASSGFFVLAAASFAALAWAPALAPVLRERFLERWALRAAAAGLVFLAFDEFFEIHEMVGERLSSADGVAGTAVGEGVFSWILVYGPIAVLGGLAVALALKRLLDAAPEREIARRTRPWILALAAGPLALIGFELAEATLWQQGVKGTVLGAFEETTELLILYALVRLNVGIARGHGA